MRSSWNAVGPPCDMTGVLIRMWPYEDTETQGECYIKMEAENAKPRNAKNCWQSPEVRKT